MSKFKVGDVVRCIESAYLDYAGIVGELYTVTEDDGGIAIVCNTAVDDGFSRGCEPSRFQLVKPAMPEQPSPDRALEWLKRAAQERASWRFDPFGTSYMNAVHDMLDDVYGLRIEVNQVVEFKPINTQELA